MNVRKILVSAGWGYRNLGDDAILLSTIKLIKEKYPEAELVVSSYNIEETIAIIDDNKVKVVPSVYRILFGVVDQYRYYDDKIASPSSFFSKMKRFLVKKRGQFIAENWMRIAIWNKDLFLKIVKRVYPEIELQFKGVDIFVMAGGGYFTSWKESILSRFLEINLSKGNGAKVLLIGQSIGPFNNALSKNTAQECLKICDRIVVRDHESYKELKAMGIGVEPEIIPDLALSEGMKYKKRKQLVFVVFYDEVSEKISLLNKILCTIAQEYNLDIIITVSQLWNGTILNGQRLMESFADSPQTFKVSFRVPRDMNDLQTLLGESELVVSQNLHGLIMAYRAETPIVCLNDKRKFVAFMDLIQLPELLIPINNVDNTNLIHAMRSALNITDESILIRTHIREKAGTEFSDSLTALFRETKEEQRI